jgi:hypothetical protein
MSIPAPAAHRLDPRRKLAPRVLLGLALVLAAIALVLTRPTKPATATVPPSGRSQPARSPAQPSPETSSARSTAEAFLEGFLKYIYGRVPASAVKGTTVAFLRSLEQQHLRMPPGMRSRHPRIVSIDAAPAAQSGSVVATALVSDEEDVYYRIAVIVASSRGRELVTGLQER